MASGIPVATNSWEQTPEVVSVRSPKHINRIVRSVVRKHNGKGAPCKSEAAIRSSYGNVLVTGDSTIEVLLLAK
jgi:hypothetical protein